MSMDLNEWNEHPSTLSLQRQYASAMERIRVLTEQIVELTKTVPAAPTRDLFASILGKQNPERDPADPSINTRSDDDEHDPNELSDEPAAYDEEQHDGA